MTTRCWRQLVLLPFLAFFAVGRWLFLPNIHTTLLFICPYRMSQWTTSPHHQWCTSSWNNLRPIPFVKVFTYTWVGQAMICVQLQQFYHTYDFGEMFLGHNSYSRMEECSPIKSLVTLWMVYLKNYISRKKTLTIIGSALEPPPQQKLPVYLTRIYKC